MADPTTMEIPPQLEPLIEGVKRLYWSGDYADLEIVRQERTWKVHKFCLCAQSEFFPRACSGNFMEGMESKIHLDDNDPEVVDAFIHYLYNFDYSDGFSAIVLDVRVYVIADKYFVAPLKDLAARKFEEGAKAWRNTRAFADAVAEVYQSTAAGKSNPLKKAIIKVVKKHAKELLDAAKGHGYFLEVLGETAEFGKDVSMALAPPIAGGWFKCPNCATIFAVQEDLSKFTCPNNCYALAHALFWIQSLVED